MPNPSLTARRTGVKMVRFVLGAILGCIFFGQIFLSIVLMLKSAW